MTKELNPVLPKKGGLGVLALVLLLLFSCTQSEITATPTKIEAQINEAISQKLAEKNTAQMPLAEVTLPPKTSAIGAVSLDAPKPKIDPELVRQLKEEKRQNRKQRIKVLIDAKDDEALRQIQQTVSQAGGEVQQSFSIGDIAVVELPADKIEEIAQAAGIEQIAAEKEYVALLQDRIPAFSIDTAGWQNNITGKNVKIAILDTGVGPHNSLIVAQGASFVAGEDSADQNGHGTHVAGIAQGIAKDAAIYNAKVLNKHGSGTTSQIIAGINWAVEQDVDIISMSFGGMFTELDGPLASAVKEAIQQGVIFVAASGNCKQGCGGFFGVTTPGNVKEVISVGAVDDNNVVASFSSGDTFGEYIKPDVVAPGVDITSAWIDNSQSTKSGTSMSTPFVAGVIGLLLEKEQGLTQEQVKQKLEASATDSGDVGKDVMYGSGIINIANLIAGNFNPPAPIQNTSIFQSELPLLVNDEDWVLVDADFAQQPDWVTTECPENLAYSPELNLTITEFFIAYDYCISQLQFPLINESEIVQEAIQIYMEQPVEFYTTPEFYVASEGTTYASEYDALKAGLRQKIALLSDIDFLALENRTELSEFLAQAVVLDFDDNYVFNVPNPTAAQDDARVWGGSSLQVQLQDPLAGTQVICYDLCAEASPTNTYDKCYPTGTTQNQRNNDFNQCRDDPTVSAVCSTPGNCPNTTAAGEIPIVTGSSGTKRKCTVYAKGIKNCAGASQSPNTYNLPYFIFDKRQFQCESTGGQFSDKGRYTSTSWENIAGYQNCLANEGCDPDEDGDNADYGTNGLNAPTKPCSLLDGQSCTSNSQCVNQCVGGQCSSSSCSYNPLCGYTRRHMCTSSTQYSTFNAVTACNGGCSEGASTPSSCTTGTYCPMGTSGTTYDNTLPCTPCSTLCDNLCVASTCLGTDPDCTALCGPGCNNNAICDAGETNANCPNDCLANPCNNNGVCNSPQETNANCPNDCPANPCNNNGVCNSPQETTANCPNDCPPPPTCNDSDRDGYGNPSTGCTNSGSDCNDTNNQVYPGRSEDCGTAYDDNCVNGANEGCAPNIQLVNFVNVNPSSPDQGGAVFITVKVKNFGNMQGSKNLEVAIAPNYWENYNIFEYEAAQTSSTPKCCPGNNYYAATRVTLGPGQEEDVTLQVYAPTLTSTNACTGGNNNVLSAWDWTGHKVVAGLYETCGDGIGYVDELLQNIKIRDKPCGAPSECPSGTSCIFEGYNGKCLQAVCPQSCTPGSYSCKENSMYRCTDNDEDGCYEKTYVKNCDSGTVCEDGKSTCTPRPPTTLQLEESTGTIIAQPGDIITVHLKYSQAESVELKFDSVFTLDSSTCPSGSFTITGNRECKLTLSNSASAGDYKIWLRGGTPATVRVLFHPQFLIITDKPKLYQGFSDQNGVYQLLQRAYTHADQKDAVIYDLSDYDLGVHPWSNFYEYAEEYDNHRHDDNTYAQQVSNFVESKCNACDNVLILGDDFVVPHFRRTLNVNSYLFLEDDPDEIYTDVGYTLRTDKAFNEFEELFYQKDNFNGKNVLFVVPDAISPEQRAEIERLKAFITDSSGPIKGQIAGEREASDAPCNDHLSFTYYDGYTLIIVGTPSSNQALDCFPFVIENDDLESVTIERNPWDGRAYAIVVNSDNVDQLKFLNDLLEDRTYKNLTSSGWLVARTAANVAAGAAISAAVVATAGGASPLFLIAAIGTGYAVDAVDGAECIKFQGDQCQEFIVGLALPFGVEKVGKPLVKAAINIIGPQIRYFYQALGEDGFTAFLKRMGKRGLLKAGSGLDDISAGLKEIDFPNPRLKPGEKTLSQKLSEYFAKSGEEFSSFLSQIAKTNRPRAMMILKIAHAANFDQSQLSKIIASNGIPTNMLVKSVDELTDGFKVALDEVLTYGNGQLRPAFRGLFDTNEVKISAALATGNIDDVVKAIEQNFGKAGSNGYDFIRQIEDGGRSDQAVASLTPDFGLASKYATSEQNPGVVLVFDKRFAPIVDSQQTLKPLDEAIPKAEIKLQRGTSLIERAYGSALLNNEASMVGKPSIEWVVGWYEVRKGADGLISKKFVPNPKYLGKQAEWSHIKSVDQIKQLHNDNGIANYDRIVEWQRSNGVPDEDLAEFGLDEGNTAFWPTEVA